MSYNQNNQIDIQQQGYIYNNQLQMIQAEQFLQELEQNSQKMIEKQSIQQEQNINIKLQQIKNPVSSYMMFVKSWKHNHPSQKFNLSALGQIWKSMSLSEKQPYEVQYRERRKMYDQYQASSQVNNANQHSNETNLSRSLFPLARVRAIMKQDSFYAPKVEATLAIAKATEYFAEYFLQETKKLTQGQNRIDSKALYDCINNNRAFSFLECLIEEHNKEGNDLTRQKKIKPSIRLEFQQQQKKYEKPQPKPKIKSAVKPVVTGQMSLDSFIFKQR